ncbi:MAG: ABC transporter substrate-binding protein [Chloroflexota bacterium]|nr:MAG: ABC transporter substrate-binding protein [Chloroflexota bacterium]
MAASFRPRTRRADSVSRILVVPLLALLTFLAACGPSAVVPTAPPDATSSAAPPATATPVAPTATPAPTFPLTITDDEGTSVQIATEPRHIVSLTPAATETLFALGAGDRVVAKVEDIAAYPPGADDLPVVATFQGVDVEQIVSLEADLVIAGGGSPSFTPTSAIEQLRRVGIPVVVLYARSIEQSLAGIRLVGLATGTSAEADQLTAAMATEMADHGAATAVLEHPTVFYEIDATSKIYTVPEDSLYAEMLILAGADPITTDDSYEISLEELVAADPDVILLGDDADYTTAADVAARPGWGDITAVKDGAVIPLADYVLVTRPGPRLVEGLRALIEALHPEVLR